MAYMKSNAVANQRGRILSFVNPDVYGQFKDICRETGTPINVILEAFMRQYVFEGLELPLVKIDSIAKAQLGTTIDKIVVDAFKAKCKSEGNTIKIVLESFIKLYNEGKYELALRKKNKVDENQQGFMQGGSMNNILAIAKI